MSSTKLICIKSKNLRTLGFNSLEEWLEDPNHIYIGRLCQYVKGTHSSKWRNPFSVSKYGRDECLRKYKDYIRSNKELMGSLSELKGKILGCWCHPEKCHGDILIELLNESLNELSGGERRAKN